MSEATSGVPKSSIAIPKAMAAAAVIPAGIIMLSLFLSPGVRFARPGANRFETSGFLNPVPFELARMALV